MLFVDFVTLFPEMVLGACGHSILARAKESGKVKFSAASPRDFATDRHRTVDDTPYGGGPGMVLKPDVVAAAIESIPRNERTAIVSCEPTGRLFTQTDARELSQLDRIVFVCGHYEGIDDRVRQAFATHVFSIGDYVLTGGELPALVMSDAVVRLVPGVLGSAESLEIDSHEAGLLSAPQYTRPEHWNRGTEGQRDHGNKGKRESEGIEGNRRKSSIVDRQSSILTVPPVLVSGDHVSAVKWKRAQALKLTRERRPDLFCRAKLEKGDLDLLSS